MKAKQRAEWTERALRDLVAALGRQYPQRFSPEVVDQIDVAKQVLAAIEPSILDGWAAHGRRWPIGLNDVRTGMTADELIELMANALGNCSEMLNGFDQMRDRLLDSQLSTKSALTSEVDAAMQAWRDWKFPAVDTPNPVEPGHS